jgi:2-polyprenyl-6-methoxyphenol hydroxylase-like FAD-dependent oxidoreductase
VVACLVKHKNNVQAAFEQYQQLRKKKAQMLNQLSYFFGRFSHQRKAWQDGLINLGLKVVPQAYINYKYDQSVNLKYLKDLHF